MSAIDALVVHRIELPPLAVLRRLAGTARAEINRTQWAAVCNGLTAVQRGALDALLVVDAKTQRSTFSALCAQPGRPSRKNLDALIERFEWLMHLPDPTPALSGVADVKVMLWANEARRLNALELREYVASRRHTLLLAAIRAARGQVLDELTQMLLRLARKIEHRSQQVLAEWYQSRHSKTDNLIHALRDALIVHGRVLAAQEKVAQIEAVLSTHGGRESLARDCDAHLRHERQNWRPFAHAIFVPFRSTLLHLAHMLPMQKAPGSPDLLRLVEVVTDAASKPDYLFMDGVVSGTIPRVWRALVHDHPSDPHAFNRRQLEVVVVLELASAIRAGEVFVQGSLSFERFWDRLPSEATRPAAIEAYAASRGWAGGREDFIRALKRELNRQAMFLDRAVGSGDQAFLQRGRHGRPVVARLRAVGTPETAMVLETQLMDHMPERPVLEALANTAHWAKWGRHFGPPSRQGP